MNEGIKCKYYKNGKCCHPDREKVLWMFKKMCILIDVDHAFEHCPWE